VVIFFDAEAQLVLALEENREPDSGAAAHPPQAKLREGER
jgi:hypothetical protein